MKTCKLLLSRPFLGLASYVEPNRGSPRIDHDSKKGPPGLIALDLANSNGAELIIAKYGTSNFSISSMQMAKGIIDKLSDGVENRTSAPVKSLNQSVGSNTNYSGII